MLRLTERLQRNFAQHNEDENDSINEASSITSYVTRILNTRSKSCNIRPEMGVKAFDTSLDLSTIETKQDYLADIEKQLLKYEPRIRKITSKLNTKNSLLTPFACLLTLERSNKHILKLSVDMKLDSTFEVTPI